MKRYLPVALAIMLLGVAQSAEAFRFGGRTGVYTEKYQDACLDAREWGLTAYLFAEGSPEKDCKKKGGCGGHGDGVAPGTGYSVTRIVEYAPSGARSGY